MAGGTKTSEKMRCCLEAQLTSLARRPGRIRGVGEDCLAMFRRGRLRVAFLRSKRYKVTDVHWIHVEPRTRFLSVRSATE